MGLGPGLATGVQSTDFSRVLPQPKARLKGATLSPVAGLLRQPRQRNLQEQNLLDPFVQRLNLAILGQRVSIVAGSRAR